MSFLENQNPSYVLVRCDGEDDEAVLADWAINGIPDESGVLFGGVRGMTFSVQRRHRWMRNSRFQCHMGAVLPMVLTLGLCKTH